jgi:2-octaprenyl-6-methoxyphenol hydroxylase
LVAALLLARYGLRSTVVDARSVEDARNDARLLALSRGTWDLVSPLLDSPPPRAPIRDVYVSSVGEFGSVHLAAADFDGTDLGATVRYGDLLVALARSAAANPLVEMRRPLSVIGVEQRPDAVEIRCAGDQTWTAPLAINAEGWSEGARRADDSEADVALVGDLQVSGPKPGSAFERFTREGPLALLPAPGAVLSYSLVWCMPPAAATRRQQLGPTSLQNELQTLLGRIGRIEQTSPLRRYPLVAHQRETVRIHRIVAVGNAAQTLHPVAGQGFNLGVRDCATLADCLSRSDSDIAAALAEHQRRRTQDRAAIVGVTRWLPAVFATRLIPIAMARSLGLAALDLLPPLRRELGQLLMFGVRT